MRAWVCIIFAIFWSVAAASAVDYLLEVKPLLRESCLKCHGPSQQKGKLRVDTAAFLKKGGKLGPSIIPGDAAKSPLVQALRGSIPDMDQMPLKKTPFTEKQIALIERWINDGALAPADEKEESELHWSFKPPQKSRPQNAVAHPIDAFILQTLSQKKLNLSPEADKLTLLRRIHLDLTGLPPSPEDQESFLKDNQRDAYEKVVARLLASPHFGERWGRLWLDVARYADSNGYSVDAPRSQWPYRDWVIRSFNANKPFDQFVVEQMAGDLLPDRTQEQWIATGFHRNSMINEEGGIDPEQFRVEYAVDRINTVATAFLGLTVACAQCHDHKFDPISHEEYYQLYSFMNSIDDVTIDVGDPETIARRQEVRGKIMEQEKALAVLQNPLIPASLAEEEVARLPAEVKTAWKTPEEKRTEKQRRFLRDHFSRQDPEIQKMKEGLLALQKSEPKLPTTMVVQERSTPRPTFIHIKGDFTRPGKPVSRGVPAILPPLGNPQASRLDLARWLVDRRHPLTARVTVNRFWQQLFGKGLVETENDFGTQGSLPTHPELLDWLAADFMEQGWNVKELVRLIVTSRTYRQSSRLPAELKDLDPYNKLYARQSRLRLDAEIVRDVSLSASGLLFLQVGGPSVFPTQPEGVMTLGQSKREWKPSVGGQRYRRGMYTHFWRATPHPSLSVFDAPDATSTCTRRVRSNTPLQALTLLNDQAAVDCAQALADRLKSDSAATDEERMQRAFQWTLGRRPNPAEHNRLLELVRAEKQRDPQSNEWFLASRVLLNLDETITRE